mgnify:CR=1 FL=1
MTKIPWTDKVWNPVTGCTKIAAGCKNCYAEAMAKRFWKGRKFTDVRCHSDRLDIPLHWKKSRKIFICSMGDLFHEKVPFRFIDKVMAVIYQSFWLGHKFQILTKKPERMLEYFHDENLDGRILRIMRKKDWATKKALLTCEVRRMPHLWLGVSVSTQADADKNIPILLQIPAAVRFVSIEPMLQWIRISPEYFGYLRTGKFRTRKAIKEYQVKYDKTAPKLNWIIIGCESGPGARLCELDDIRNVRDQCKEAGVPVFIKQIPINGKCSKNPAEWPEDMRVQEFPKC